jgi:uncharacterized protein RhaS with RHS repeats
LALATKPTVGLRYYNPQTGRYISRDPHGYPNGLNNYLYVNDNPINRIDPLGLMWGWLSDAASSVADAAKAVGNFTENTAKTGLGAAVAVIHDNFNVGVDPATISDPAFTRGATLGHEIVVAQALVEAGVGTAVAGLGADMTITGTAVALAGAVAELPSVGLSTPVTAGGALTAASGVAITVGGAAMDAHAAYAGLRAAEALRNQSCGTAGNGPEGGGTTGNPGKETGSYTNTHESGKTYSGKGDKERSQASGNERAAKNQDPHTATDWKPEANDRDAFKAESRRIDAAGGHKDESNYNKIESPGKIYRKEDGELP